MERTVEIPQLQLVQQNDEIPESRRLVPERFRFEAPGGEGRDEHCDAQDDVPPQ